MKFFLVFDSVGNRMGQVTQTSKHLLYADDSIDSCELIVYLLQEVEAFNFKVTFAESAAKSIQVVQEQRFDVIVLDQYYLDGTGVDVCGYIRQIGITTPVIFYTGDSRDATRQEAIAAGAQFYLTKPSDLGALVDAIVQVVSV
ncbi:MAG: response regulator [Oscillatoriales cyanobacterium C42_A2020_001]|nr:response regulator [Leptolyngbyaceae cyanobacterium C42_A2020_001]